VQKENQPPFSPSVGGSMSPWCIAGPNCSLLRAMDDRIICDRYH